ncbi:MAG: carbohydrate ABC transporter permease [Anaerolineales bacterium]|nr:carbohydrate ABC transporter permease [Anaerolineales bacterium]MDW8161294.1 carbohydrate ABC transporter permease [Anaerolineales bacterium]
MSEAGLYKRFQALLKRYNLRVGDIPLWLAGLIVAVMWIAPFVWMVSTSLKPPKEVLTKEIEWLPRTVVMDNYRKVFQYPVLRWAWNSLVVAGTATFFGVLFGAMAGYALARLHFPGNQWLFAVLIASLMIPTEMTIVPMFVGFLKAGLANTYFALIVPAIPNVFSVYIFRQFFLGLPDELEDAAAIDGANRFQIFWQIALPLARAPLLAATILLFTTNWNAFLWPLLIVFEENMKTMPVGIAAFTPVVGTHTQLEGFGIAMAGVTLLSLPSLLIFFLLQRYFIEGISRTGIKG